MFYEVVRSADTLILNEHLQYKALGFGGEIHTHESPQGTIYMPGPQM